jgi:hypothetical protein
MVVSQQQRLEDLAEALTRQLSIPFQTTTNGAITFRDRLRVTDWAVPLMFDGHARRDHDALIPTDFVGHLLWPTLRVTRGSAQERPWWSCTLSPKTAEALVEALRGEDEHDDEEDDRWVIGRDVLLDEAWAAPQPIRHRQVA